MTMKTAPLIQAASLRLSFVRSRGAGDDDVPAAIATADSLTVPKAKCGPNDHPETALQGQVPAACARRLQGFNCNLELVGQ